MFWNRAEKTAAPMTPATAIAQVAAGDAVLIDIRELAELRASGKADGAIHIPLATLRMQADPRSPECHPALKEGKPVIVYCASGGRATMASQALKQMGHAEVHNIGGLVHWAQAGGPVVKV